MCFAADPTVSLPLYPAGGFQFHGLHVPTLYTYKLWLCQCYVLSDKVTQGGYFDPCLKSADPNPQASTHSCSVRTVRTLRLGKVPELYGTIRILHFALFHVTFKL